MLVIRPFEEWNCYSVTTLILNLLYLTIAANTRPHLLPVTHQGHLSTAFTDDGIVVSFASRHLNQD
jgi:hypothetical protein